MEVYKLPIETAFIIFPLVAFLLTLPFLIHQYRKYGAIPILKSFIFYSLVLYLLVAYFLIILPLPTLEEISKMTPREPQLIPFTFIKDILKTFPNNINSFSDILNLLNTSSIYTVIFNFLLTIPFGIYLRYFFNKKWYQTVLYSFLLSLFFECTQLSGLYGIYPQAYRTFDVDDLMINTIGGLFGYFITPILLCFLPTRKELDKQSYEKGKKVTFLRRCIALLIDIFCLAILSFILKILFYNIEWNEYSTIIAIGIYYIVIPLCTKGQTIGKRVVSIKIESTKDILKWYQLITRNLILSFLILYPSVWVQKITQEEIRAIISTTIWIIQIINIAAYMKKDKNKERRFLYERITHTKNISTIKYEIEEKNISEEKEQNIKEKTKNTV